MRLMIGAKLASLLSFFFFFNDTATTEIYTLSLHDALPIYVRRPRRRWARACRGASRAPVECRHHRTYELQLVSCSVQVLSGSRDPKVDVAFEVVCEEAHGLLEGNHQARLGNSVALMHCEQVTGLG